MVPLSPCPHVPVSLVSPVSPESRCPPVPLSPRHGVPMSPCPHVPVSPCPRVPVSPCRVPVLVPVSRALRPPPEGDTAPPNRFLTWPRLPPPLLLNGVLSTQSQQRLLPPLQHNPFYWLRGATGAGTPRGAANGTAEGAWLGRHGAAAALTALRRHGRGHRVPHELQLPQAQAAQDLHGAHRHHGRRDGVQLRGDGPRGRGGPCEGDAPPRPPQSPQGPRAPSWSPPPSAGSRGLPGASSGAALVWL